MLGVCSLLCKKRSRERICPASPRLLFPSAPRTREGVSLPPNSRLTEGPALGGALLVLCGTSVPVPQFPPPPKEEGAELVFSVVPLDSQSA